MAARRWAKSYASARVFSVDEDHEASFPIYHCVDPQRYEYPSFHIGKAEQLDSRGQVSIDELSTLLANWTARKAINWESLGTTVPYPGKQPPPPPEIPSIGEPPEIPEFPPMPQRPRPVDARAFEPKLPPWRRRLIEMLVGKENTQWKKRHNEAITAYNLMYSLAPPCANVT